MSGCMMCDGAAESDRAGCLLCLATEYQRDIATSRAECQRLREALRGMVDAWPFAHESPAIRAALAVLSERG